MSFLSSHHANISRGTGAASATKTAVVILAIDADFPWIPTKVIPSNDAIIYHIDMDPRKDKMRLSDGFLTNEYLDEGLGIALRQDGPDYGGNARSAANGDLETWRVDKSEDLDGILKRAVECVKSGKGALIDAVVKW
ncbi:MAG: hypothetical protein M1820_006045 [Bogoriella megaspora]|nr:MAG: hypothetical protein M1820_006045 [Bogoriella megaspora]